MARVNTNDMVILLVSSIIVVALFSLNFNRKWTNRNYELLKDRKGIWFWFRIFKIEETKENFIKFNHGLSVFVIVIMIVAIIITSVRQ
jgi:hypothetical protein